MKKTKWFAWLAGLVLGASLGMPAHARCTPHVGSPVNDMSMLEVKPISMDVSIDGGRRMVTTLGTIANPSANCFHNVVVELQYFDAAKNHVDTVVETMDGFLVPAGETVQFRVREPASRDAAMYATQSLRLVDADVVWVKGPPEGKNPFIDLLLAWAPMLLLVGVWIYFVRRQSSAKSIQSRMFVVMEKQLEVAQAQSLAIQKAAAALERRAGGDVPS
jgi:hypothetical protein